MEIKLECEAGYCRVLNVKLRLQVTLWAVGNFRRVLNGELACQNCASRKSPWWGRKEHLPEAEAVRDHGREQHQGYLIDRISSSLDGLREGAKERESLEKIHRVLLGDSSGKREIKQKVQAEL